MGGKMAPKGKAKGKPKKGNALDGDATEAFVGSAPVEESGAELKEKKDKKDKKDKEEKNDKGDKKDKEDKKDKKEKKAKLNDEPAGEVDQETSNATGDGDKAVETEKNEKKEKPEKRKADELGDDVAVGEEPASADKDVEEAPAADHVNGDDTRQQGSDDDEKKKKDKKKDKKDKKDGKDKDKKDKKEKKTELNESVGIDFTPLAASPVEAEEHQDDL